MTVFLSLADARLRQTPESRPLKERDVPDEHSQTVPFTPIADEDAVPDKGFACFDADGTGVVLGRFRGEVFAVENLCSHALSTFDDGRLRGFRLMCPLHGATFDIRDGSCTGAPASRPIRSFPVRVCDGVIEVQILPVPE